jgi:gamma-glutamylcyclotransferase
MKYFAYGMNTNTAQMAVRCPEAKPLGRAVLYGHEFRFARHADIIENPDYTTHGVLWEITPNCELALDVLEGYPNYYLKKIVTVFYNGVPVECMTYYMTGDLVDELPSDGYLEMLHEGYREYNVDDNQIAESLDLINSIKQRQIDLQAKYFPVTS